MAQNFAESLRETSVNTWAKMCIIRLFIKQAIKSAIRGPCIRLSRSGITGDILLWISKWLNYRKQKASINGQFAQQREINRREPRRSIMGPALF